MALISDYVAWTTMFGETFVGLVTWDGYDSKDIKRVDGGICTVKNNRLRQATLDELDDNIAYFTEGALARYKRTGKV